MKRSTTVTLESTFLSKILGVGGMKPSATVILESPFLSRILGVGGMKPSTTVTSLPLLKVDVFIEITSLLKIWRSRNLPQNKTSWCLG